MTASGENSTGAMAAADADGERRFDWGELLQLVRDRKVIPVVGKELLAVSIDGQEILVEQYLAARLAEALGVERQGLSQRFDVNEVAVAHLEKGGLPRKIYTRLREIVEERPLPVPEPLRQLAAIAHFQLFISTTFDSLLAEAIDLERYAGAARTGRLAFSTNAPLEELPSERAKLADAQVFQIFGRLSGIGDYAVTEEDILEFLHALQSEARQPRTLFEELKNTPLLFLGCSFPDGLARFFLRTLANRRLLPPEGAKFVVDRRVKVDLNLALFLRQCRIDIDPAGDPVAFVSELHHRWQLVRSQVEAKEQEPAQRKMEPNAVFLSFAGEDRPAARGLRAALERKGLDVWFDERSIPPGAAWDLEIQANIRRCSLFVPLLSQHAARRPEGYFRREWRWALERAQAMDDSIPFIQPVVIDDLQSGASGIPEGFRARQWSRFPVEEPPANFIAQAIEVIRNLRSRQAGYS
jgi:hypothetical protein